MLYILLVLYVLIGIWVGLKYYIDTGFADNVSNDEYCNFI